MTAPAKPKPKALAKPEPQPPARIDPAEALYRVVGQGDLSALTAEERTRYILEVCNALQLNPLTRPFEIISFKGRTVLYARKDCTEQLRVKHRISLVVEDARVQDGVYVVTARAINGETGREDMSIGAVAVAGIRGEELANAMMKAETKAKRRVTLSICGLGMLDESEVDDKPAPPPKVVQPPALPPKPEEPQPAPGPLPAAAEAAENGHEMSKLMHRVGWSWNQCLGWMNHEFEAEYPDGCRWGEVADDHRLCLAEHLLSLLKG